MYQHRLFEEVYRVLAVKSQGMTVEGPRSGTVLTIRNHDAEIPMTAENYPLGTLIRLSDASFSMVQ